MLEVNGTILVRGTLFSSVTAFKIKTEIKCRVGWTERERARRCFPLLMKELRNYPDGFQVCFRRSRHAHTQIHTAHTSRR